MGESRSFNFFLELIFKGSKLNINNNIFGNLKNSIKKNSFLVEIAYLQKCYRKYLEIHHLLKILF